MWVEISLNSGNLIIGTKNILPCLNSTNIGVSALDEGLSGGSHPNLKSRYGVHSGKTVPCHSPLDLLADARLDLDLGHLVRFVPGLEYHCLVALVVDRYGPDVFGGCSAWNECRFVLPRADGLGLGLVGGVVVVAQIVAHNFASISY